MISSKMPLATIILLSYNQEKYISQAVNSIFAQDYENIEIVISDDSSVDSTFDLILKEVEKINAKNKAKFKNLIVRRTVQNLGISGHISEVMEKVSGDLVVIAAGDDISYSNRVSKIVEYWVSEGMKSGSIFSGISIIDKDGNEKQVPPNKNLAIKIDGDYGEEIKHFFHGTLGCAHAWTRDVFDVFGKLDKNIIHEDISIPLRSIMLGEVHYIADVLVKYRIIDGTQSRISYANTEERMHRMIRYWGGRVANFKQLDHDILVARERGFINEVSASIILNLGEFSRKEAEYHFIFYKLNFFERIKFVFANRRTVRAKLYFKCLVISLFPFAYGIF